jgi:hypothetical protein
VIEQAAEYRDQGLRYLVIAKHRHSAAEPVEGYGLKPAIQQNNPGPQEAMSPVGGIRIPALCARGVVCARRRLLLESATLQGVSPIQ